MALVTSSFFRETVVRVCGKWLATLPRGPGFGVSLMVVFLIAGAGWARPIARYIKTREPVLRHKALRRFAGLFRFLAWLWVARAVVGTIIARLTSYEPWTWGAWATWTLGTVVGSYYGAYFTMLFLEPLILLWVARSLHGQEELFTAQSNPVLSVHARLVLLVINLVLMPLILFALVHYAGLNDDAGPAPTIAPNIIPLLFITFAYAAGSLEALYRGITMPLDELNRKMTRLANGEFDVKTSVVNDDEIGRLTAHFNGMVDGLAERDRLKDTFGRYVSVEVAKKLIESGKIALGGESIEATILFSDIRDFTPLSERLSPQDLVSFLNGYFSHVTEPIAANHGVVNKYIGDAVMAVFAPQFGSQDHVGDGVRAALGMRTAVAQFNASRPGQPPVAFGVGVHTGTLVAGNIGTEKRLEYTVIGDTVNIASRIESQTKALASTILVSEDVYSRLDTSLRDAVEAQRCEDVRLKGKQRPLVLYKLA